MLIKPLVSGPGHSLNELTNRLINVGRFISHGEECWEMYAGPLGLYARHSDDYALDEYPELNRYYNDFVRNPGITQQFSADEKDILHFMELWKDIKVCMYLNTHDVVRVGKYFNECELYTTILDLENSEHKHHHLMMEFATGALSPGVSYPDISKPRLCKRLVKKAEAEHAFIKTVPSTFNIVNANDLLNGNFDALSFVIKENARTVMQTEIDKYNFYNQCSHPTLIEISEMSWEEIIAESKDCV